MSIAMLLLAATAVAVQITEFPVGAGSVPDYITAGPDGNMWFTDPGSNKIGRISTSGQITEFGVGLTANSGVSGIAVGPDGNLWFTERGGGRVGRITTSGIITEFPTSAPDTYGIAAGPDGNMWFTETFVSRIGVINPTTGQITDIPIYLSAITKIVAGPDGNLWYTALEATETKGGYIGRITPAGADTLFGPLPQSACTPGAPPPCPYPEALTVGPDGNLWFEEARGNAIGRITPTGHITEYSAGLSQDAGAADLAPGPDGNVWFTELNAGQIGRVTPAGTITEFHTGLSPGAQPFGIALGPDGNLWFAERNGSIGRLIPDVPPIVNTGSSSAVTAGSTIVTGNVRSRGSDTRYLFEYGTSTHYGSSSPSADNGAGDTTNAVTVGLSGLRSGTTYYYRLVASNANGTTYATNAVFTTPGLKQVLRHVSVRAFQMYFSGSQTGSRLRISRIALILLGSGEHVSYACLKCLGSPRHGSQTARRSRLTFTGLRLVVSRDSRLVITVAGKDKSRRVKVYGVNVRHAEVLVRSQHCYVAHARKPVPCRA